MDAPELFRSSLSLVERLAHALCRRASVPPADVEDFIASAKLHLIEDDYAVLRAFQRRCSLATYLSAVLQRLLANQRNRTLGRWRSSAAAEKLGSAAVLLETLTLRDGRSIDEALPIVQVVDPSLTPARAAAMVESFPPRWHRPRAVDVEDVEIVSAERADAQVLAGDAQRTLDRAGRVVRETLATFTAEDRTIVRMHYGSGVSVADISRMLRLPQRPLYRRVETLLAKLRANLVQEGFDAHSIAEVIGAATTDDVDFGLRNSESGPESGPERQSNDNEGPWEARETS